MKILPAIASLTLVCAAQAAEPVSLPVAPPEVGASVLRVLGGLVFVLALFLGGVWAVRNWQRVAVQRGQAPKLNVLEVKSLGQRNALYVVGYEQQRLLLASSATGVTLLSHLPNADAGEITGATTPSFAEALQQVLTRKP
ncbi:MAG: flagellar biosynthetic protein FliO [Verrucomicrobia bacterium]|nr:flagellar biosynthetic protein FliO [Verrucomicrobiota bacterium]